MVTTVTPPPPTRSTPTISGLSLGLTLGLLACTGQPDPDPAGTPGTDDSGGESGDTGTALACPEAPAAPELSDGWELLARPQGGDFLHLAEAAADPLRVYAGSTMNGAYRSDDGGQSWTRLPIEVTHIASQIAVDPHDADRVFLSTGELMRSTTGGMGWERTGVGLEGSEGLRIRGLIFDGPELVLADSEGGIWRAEGDLDTLEQVGSIPAVPPPPHASEDNPFGVDDSYLWLARGDEALFAVREGAGLYRSLDGGESWETLEEGDLQVMSLGASGDTVWAATAFELLLSEDGGESFTRHDTLEAELTGGALLEDGTLLLVAGDQVLEPADGVLQERTTVEGAHSLRQVLALSDGSVLVGDQDGLHRSTDGAVSFTASAEGIEVLDLGPLLAHGECAGLVWTGTQCERGLFASSAYGEDLAYVDDYMHYVMVPRQSPARPWEIWVTTDDMLKRSLDLGQTWERVAPDTLVHHLHGLAIHPTEPELVLVGTVGSGKAADERARVLRSEDHGESWTDSSTGLPETSESLHALHFVEADPDIVLAGTFRGGDMGHSVGDPGIGMFRSTDSGRTWRPAGPEGLADVPLFAECEGRLYAATDQGLLWSDDLGEAWTEGLASDLPFLSVACHGALVLAMDEATIYRSDDAGGSWVEWTTGLSTEGWTPRSMPQLAIGSEGRVAYAAIPGRGLHRSGL